MRTIHATYYEVRRRIQKLSRHKPLTSKKFMEKYSSRERRKTHDLCLRIAKAVVEFAKEHEPRHNIRGSEGHQEAGKLREKPQQQTPSWNFRKLQLFIEYKAKLNGLPVMYVDPHKTSSFCPICGGRLAPKGRRLMKCKKCGYENDRDVIACLNMLRMRELPFPLKALR